MKKNRNRRGAAIVLALLVAINSIGGRGLLPGIVSFADVERQAVVNATTLNVRSGAGTDFSVVDKLTNGASVVILGETNGSDGMVWYQIRFSGSTGTEKTGYVRSDYIRFPTAYTSDSDFEAYLSSQGFPESYKTGLRQLHALYPNWVFTAQHTNLDWNTVIENESLVGRNLVYNGSISSWKSTADGAYDWETSTWPVFDSGSYVASSPALIAYYMDPRNFLDDKYVFQFLLHSYDASSHTEEGLRSMVEGTFLTGTAEVSNEYGSSSWNPGDPMGDSGSEVSTQAPGSGSSGSGASTQGPGSGSSGSGASTQGPGSGSSGTGASTQGPGSGSSGVGASTQGPGSGSSGSDVSVQSPGTQYSSGGTGASRQAPGQSYSSSAGSSGTGASRQAPGQTYSSSGNSGGSGASRQAPGQTYSSSGGSGGTGASRQAPGQSYSSSGSSSGSGASRQAPGQTYSSTGSSSGTGVSRQAPGQAYSSAGGSSGMGASRQAPGQTYSSSGSSSGSGVSRQAPGTAVSSAGGVGTSRILGSAGLLTGSRHILMTLSPGLTTGPGGTSNGGSASGYTPAGPVDDPAMSSSSSSYTGGSDAPTVDYVSILMNAGVQSGVNPYVLASMILQEQGTNGTSDSISGDVPGYEGYYNYFNIEAYRSGDMEATARGLWYASQSGSYGRPWDSIDKSIVGGALYYGTNYVEVGQDTFYLKKFNVQGSNLYKHQYMTNVQGAASEGARLSEAYGEQLKQTSKLEFKIPVYQNMPDAACAKPTADGSPNNKLSFLGVDGFSITPTFNRDTETYDLIVNASVTEVNVSASAYSDSAVISGTGTVSLQGGNNEIRISVKAQNGDVRVYVIRVVKQQDGPSYDGSITPETGGSSYPGGFSGPGGAASSGSGGAASSGPGGTASSGPVGGSSEPYSSEGPGNAGSGYSPGASGPGGSNVTIVP